MYHCVSMVDPVTINIITQAKALQQIRRRRWSDKANVLSLMRLLGSERTEQNKRQNRTGEKKRNKTWSPVIGLVFKQAFVNVVGSREDVVRWEKAFMIHYKLTPGSSLSVLTWRAWVVKPTSESAYLPCVCVCVHVMRGCVCWCGSLG